MSHPSIAIVGMACRYPDSRTPQELWENVLAQRRAFRRIPRERLDAADYLSTHPRDTDSIYTDQAAVLEGWSFDRERFRIAGPTFRQVDLTHWLALEVAAASLADAGFVDGEGLPREMTGVIVGNTLTGEFSRANTMRLRWPYVRRVTDASLRDSGASPTERRTFLAALETRYKAPFPQMGEESLAGGLSNTIAGRVCNYFDLKGGGYTMDGACASSLLAVANACSLLVGGDLDVAIAGGVDLSLDPFELVGFARAGALAPEHMRVYDARSAGFWPGEGCGFVVLMREDDAAAQGRRIYARVRGWGVASDGSGGITRPEAEGQLLAVKRAYRRAGFDAASVAYVEGHGTGTQVGDAVELEVLSRARRDAGAHATAALGSIKANIGHTKAAAGIAGLLKATLALHHQVIPPTTGCFDPHPTLAARDAVLHIVREGQPWPADQPLRAGVSAMGFGGIDAHVVLESTPATRKASLDLTERTMLATPQDAELFLLGAPDVAALGGLVETLRAYAGRLSLAELTDLAAALSSPAEAAVRAAVVADTPAALEHALARVAEWLQGSGEARLDIREGVFAARAGTPRIGFLFPGQASPSHLDGGVWRRRFAFGRERWQALPVPDHASRGAHADGRDTRYVQPAIVTASLVGLRALAEAGIEAAAGLGHSLGELTALHWGGAFDGDALLRIATARGRAMSEAGRPDGAMASLGTDAATARALVEDTGVVLAGLNAPRQTVISGEARAVAGVIERAKARGIGAVRLPVSHAFHSPLVAAAAEALGRRLQGETFRPLARRVYSTIAGRALGKEDLRALLLTQVLSPVRFTDAFAAADSEIDLWIEVGPGAVMSGLVENQSRTPAIALDAGGPSLAGWLRALGAAWTLGAAVRHASLFEGRFTRPFALDWQPQFLANPCESAPRDDGSEPAPSLGEGWSDARSERALEPELTTDHASRDGRAVPESILELVRTLVAARAELPATAVADDHGLLRDLHLNSIVVGQIAGEAARAMKLPPPTDPTAWAGATVAELARALEELEVTRGQPSEPEPEHAPAGLDLWVRPFEVRWVERARPQAAPATNAALATNGALAGGTESEPWKVFAAPGDPLAVELERALARVPNHHASAVVCVPAEPDAVAAERLLEAAHWLWPRRSGGCFVVVEQDDGGGGAFARTLSLESPETIVRVVSLPAHAARGARDPRAAEWIAAEANGARGYAEARYDTAGLRHEPRLVRLAGLAPAANGAAATPLGSGDVMLVTGGGKGIAAECALDLARETGARLAILGRSRPEDDSVLAANLGRLTAAGVTHVYVVTDVTDAEQVRRAVHAAESGLGPITAVLHGAGSNEPRPLAALDPESLRRTLAPKLDGLCHVLAAVPGELRLVIAFGSIIARVGMPGEADYALANEWMTRRLERYGRDHPRCRCLSVEWSVWSGVGMGEKLGRIERLARSGVTAITPDIGVRALRELLARPATPVAVVVTGRFGEPPTLRLEEREVPMLRFLERIRVDVPGVELVAEAELTSDNDPYLEGHDWNGARLFPAVMGIEAMAQAARTLLSAETTPQFESVRFERPVLLDATGRETIRLLALVRDDGGVDVAVRAAATGFHVDHYRAVCRFPSAESSADAEVAAASAATRPHAPRDERDGEPLALDPDRDLYGRVMFQSGHFRRVRGYRHLRATESVADLKPDGTMAWFGAWIPSGLLLGDPGARDAALHSIQASIPHRTLLPIAVERIEAGVLDASASFVARAHERSNDGETFVYDLEIARPDGATIERWIGLQLRAAGPTRYRGPWPTPLLGAFLERRLLECVPGQGIAAVLQMNGGTDQALRHALRALGGNGGVTHALEIARRPDGKPVVASDPALHVSAAGSGALTLAVAGRVPVGCDLEPVTPRAPEAWRTLLGPEHASLAEAVAGACREDEDAAFTRIWTALECLKKSGAPAGTPLSIAGPVDEGWLVLEAGRARVASFVATMGGGERVAIGLLTRV